MHALTQRARPVHVEYKRRRILTANGNTKTVDHAVAALLTRTIRAGATGEYARVFALVEEGKYNEAAKIAARLINAGNEGGFLVYGGSGEFSIVSSWLDKQIVGSRKAPSSIFCEVTPELAQCLILKNAGNRRLNSGNLSNILRDVCEGRWTVNGETLIISDDGRPNDGQHRLFAVLLSGIGIETAVAFGLNRQTMRTVDTGTKRDSAARLGIAGVANNVPMAAISNLILEMKIGRKPTPAEGDEFFFQNDKMIRTAYECSGSNMKGVGQAAQGAAAFYLLSNGAKPEKVKDFFVSVRTGEMLAKRDPRLTLHRSIYVTKERIRRDDWVRAFVTHFNAHMLRKKLTFTTTDETLDWSF